MVLAVEKLRSEEEAVDLGMSILWRQKSDLRCRGTPSHVRGSPLLIPGSLELCHDKASVECWTSSFVTVNVSSFLLTVSILWGVNLGHLLFSICVADPTERFNITYRYFWKSCIQTDVQIFLNITLAWNLVFLRVYHLPKANPCITMCCDSIIWYSLPRPIY